MHTVYYKGHPIRFEDAAGTRYVVIGDLYSLFEKQGVEVIPLSHLIFTSQTFINDHLIVRLALIERLFPLTDELRSVLTEGMPPRWEEFVQENGLSWTDPYNDLRMTVQELTGFLTEDLYELVMGGSADRVMKRLSDNLSYLEDTMLRLDEYYIENVA